MTDVDPASAASLHAPASTGDELSLTRFVGKVPVALCFAGDASAAASRDVIRGFDEHLADFGRHRIQALVVVEGDMRMLETELVRGETTVPVLADVDGTWARRLNVASPEAGRAMTLLLDRRGTCVERIPGGGGAHAQDVLERATAHDLG